MNRALDKFTSGKFLLTIACAIILVWTAFTQPNTFLDMKEIILVVIYAYFNRNGEQPRKGEEGKRGEGEKANV
jgi:hypothetical protein